MKFAAIIWLSGSMILLGCGKREPDKLRFTWLGEQRSICVPDTITTLPKHTDRDTMIGRIEFTYCEGRHEVTGWMDDNYAPVDGGSFWLELDDLGKIYGHSTTWPGFGVVRSNNDSLNELITMALAAASRPGHFGVRYPLPPPPKIETVDFTQVEIYDTATGENWGK